jgi:adenosylhomocysteinase
MKEKRMNSDVKDLALAAKGRLRIEWAGQSMPVLKTVSQRFSQDLPLKGKRIAACLHVTTETAALMLTIKTGGASPALCASNPLSTQDDVAAALVELGVPVFAIKGEDNASYYSHIRSVLDSKPDITMDDGADLVNTLHTERKDQLPSIIGGTEETTTGLIRLRSMAANKMLKYPIVAVNDAATKHLFDNRYGTGQSTIDGIIRATNRLMAGSIFVVSGYGWCGRGIAMRASGMGAQVIVTEVDPLRALEAVMDGYRVLPMEQACQLGDFFCTATGNTSVLREEHFLAMKEGTILANSGHFNVELDLEELARISGQRRIIRDMLEEFTLTNGKRLYVIAHGRLVNLASAEGHPSSVMDMSFANQALAVQYLCKEGGGLKPDVYPVPVWIDKEVAQLKLAAMGVAIDALTEKQEQYLHSWEAGT